MKKTIHIIVGPTAIGKSSLAMRLAKKINGKIVNADSMQVYSNLEILTARPTSTDLSKIKHELYGYVDGSERHSVAKWCHDVVKLFNENKKNTSLIFVGGTGMYIDKLLNGLINIPPIQEKYKKQSEQLLEAIGREKFINLIKTFDTKSLLDISTNDNTRIRRIWEIYSSTGIPFSEWKIKKNKKFLENINYKIYLFTPPREKIYKAVNLRFEKMIKEGALKEVKKLLKLNLDKSLPIMRAHGVPEISSFLSKKTTLDDCIFKGQQVTRNYVKRQLTWWRSSSLEIHQAFNEFPNEIDENLLKI